MQEKQTDVLLEEDKQLTEKELTKINLNYFVFDYVGHIDSKYDKAMELIENDDIISAFEIFKKYAKEEDKVAQYIVAYFYETYLPIQDISLAYEWY